MTKLDKDGLDLVTDTQAQLAAAKDALRAIARNMRQLARLDRKAGNLKAANASMHLEGQAMQALGILVAGHAVASDALLDYHPDDGQIVVMGGGGGR